MTDSTDTTPTTHSSFKDILAELKMLPRDDLLFYRVQVGSVLLRHFWRGDAAAFSSQDYHKNDRLSRFLDKYKDQLARDHLSLRQARESIRVAAVVQHFPAEVAQRLFLSQLLTLARLADPAIRLEVAHAALTYDWSVRQLSDAVNTTRAGLPLAETATLLEPSPIERAERRPAVGRMVTRAEKLVLAVEHWSGLWAQADGSRMSEPQRRRLLTAVAALEGRVAALRRGLGR